MLKNIKNWFKKNWFKFSLVIIFAVFLFVVFYWYTLRPVIIKKECYNMGAYGTNNRKALKILTSNTDSAVDSDTKLFKTDYQNCLYKNGLNN